MGKKSKRKNKGNSDAAQAQSQEQNQAAPQNQRRTTTRQPHSRRPVDLGGVPRGPYVFDQVDFRNVPRWPNDGIDREFQLYLRGEHDDKCQNYVTHDDEHNALVKILGWNPLPKPLYKLPRPKRLQYIILPLGFQEVKAKEEADWDKAEEHLIEAYKRKDPHAIDLLKKINCHKAVYKASCDKSRFPDIRHIVVPLLQKSLATHENLEILFGKVSYVRDLLLEFGTKMAVPPVAASPEGVFLSQYLYKADTKALPTPKTCANCGAVSDGTQNFSKCSACKTVHYCSKECHLKHWPIHKPDCLRIQGKEVPKAAIEKAEKLKKEREELKNQLKQQKNQEIEDAFIVELEKYKKESPLLVDSWAYNGAQQKFPVHVPTDQAEQMIERLAYYFARIQVRKFIDLGDDYFPDGIDSKTNGCYGLFMRVLDNDAPVLMLFEHVLHVAPMEKRLAVCGLYIDGLFVIDDVVNNRAKWRLVSKPTTTYTPNHNRCDRLIKYLRKARDEAIFVTGGVKLGIESSGQRFQVSPKIFNSHRNSPYGMFRRPS